jgi:hypothetical protein
MRQKKIGVTVLIQRFDGGIENRRSQDHYSVGVPELPRRDIRVLRTGVLHPEADSYLDLERHASAE